MSEKIVTLCWATVKRHIAIDGQVLCAQNFTTDGYSVKNGRYNSIQLSGIPTELKDDDDRPCCHTDGVISYAPLEKQAVVINRSSICVKCQRKFDVIWEQKL